MQRITEKRINNSNLAPSKIAVQENTFRSNAANALDMSGLMKGFNAVADFAEFIASEKEKENQEMDRLADIKLNSILKSERENADMQLEGVPLSQMNDKISSIRGNFSANVQKKLEGVPMTDRMRQYVNARLSAADEALNVHLNHQMKRREVTYIVNENSKMLHDALNNGEYSVALAQNKKLADLGVPTKYSDADIKSACTAVNLQKEFNVNNFSQLENLQKTDSDGNYTEYKELKQTDRMRLISQGKQQQNADYNNRIIDYAKIIPQFDNLEVAMADLEKQKDYLPEQVYAGMKNMLAKSVNARDKDKGDNLIAELYLRETEIKAMDNSEKEAEFKKQLGRLNNLHLSASDRLAKIKTMNTFFRPETEKQNIKYRDSFQYKLAMSIIEENKDSFTYEDNSIWRNKSDIKSANYGMAKMKTDEFIKNNPNATESDIRKFIDDMKNQINNTKQQDLISAWQNYNIPDLSVKDKIQTNAKEERRSINGRIAIFDENKKFIRWEK